MSIQMFTSTRPYLFKFTSDVYFWELSVSLTLTKTYIHFSFV